MQRVTFTFVGDNSDEIAHKFYTWVIDGGLEDSIIDTLTDDEIKVEGIADFNNESLDIAILSKRKSSM